MKTIPCSAALCGFLFAVCASASGARQSVIRFNGAIYLPASDSVAYIPGNGRTNSSQLRQPAPLRRAQHELASSVLDYFAGYAAKNAQLVNVTYD